MDARASTTTSRRAMVCALFVFAVGLALVANVRPAAADSRMCTPESRGCASFRHAGNTFDVCDYGFDGRSVSRHVLQSPHWCRELAPARAETIGSEEER